MPDINIQKIIYTIRHKYWTFNNIVIFVAFFIAASWVWGSLQVMQRNFALQKEVDQKSRQLQLTELQKQSLELQQRYYKTDEYKELAVRESLGLVMPGESVVILPKNSQAALDADKKVSPAVVANSQATESNTEQWLNFLFGGYNRTVNENK